MKLLGVFVAALGVWPKTVHLTLADEGISATEVGIHAVHAMTPGDETARKKTIKQFKANGRTTVVGRIELGELSCDSLADVQDSTLVRFAISSNETVVANRTSYSSFNASVAADGKERKIWMGNVVDPKPVYPRTVTMVWTDPCEMESFVLKIVSTNADGTTAITKSTMCEAGSSKEFCIVELSVKFPKEEEEPIELDEKSDDRRLKTTKKAKEPIHARGLLVIEDPKWSNPDYELPTTVEVIVLYTRQAWQNFNMTEEQLVGEIEAAFVRSNDAMFNSDINLDINHRYTGPVPGLRYKQDSYIIETEFWAFFKDPSVNRLRNEHRADLVMLIGAFENKCGVGLNFKNGKPRQGFSATSADCLDNHSHTHEMGHNFGCQHNRKHTSLKTSSSHGMRYCDADSDPFITIMSYPGNDCTAASRVNFFSSPGITWLEKPTGDEAHDNAQTIRNNMVAVSQYRDPCVLSNEGCTEDYECCSDSCVKKRCAEEV